MSATIRNYTNMEQYGSIVFATDLTNFPENPKRGQQSLVNGVLWMYSMVGGLLTWYPLTNKKNTHVHTQGLASVEWIVTHNLGTQDFILGVYDADNNQMSPSGITQITNDSFRVTFSEPVTGRLVAFFDSESFVPAVNTEDVATDTLTVANGVVSASSSGLLVNGKPVLAVNSNDQMDFGTL